jgi:hypothetical protein
VLACRVWPACSWTVLGFELAGMLGDFYELARWYDRKAPVAWLVVHSVIIGTVISFLGGA